MILSETQEDRDRELSLILNISIRDVESKEIASPGAIRIFAGTDIPSGSYTSLYENFRYLDLTAYLRTLMFTSIKRRGTDLIRLLQTTKSRICLDFGCGVGSHAIALLENNNQVDILDVDGPLLNFAKERIKRRGLYHLCKVYLNTQVLPDRHYDLVICTDVLEHVYDPIFELSRITKSLRRDGLLYLCVSTMVKNSSGHFLPSIKKWKENGSNYLKEHYTRVRPFLYRKKL